MRRRLLSLFPLCLLAALVAAPAALGGGFATVGLSSTPAGVAPGDPWNVEITVLQHGRTPLDDLVPRVRIHSGDATREFKAVPAGKPGVYRAEVVFPAAGSWTYEVLDGFIDAQPHTFPAVEIGGAGSPAAPAATAAPPATAPEPRDGGIAAGWLWGAGAAALLALAVLALDRRRRSPEPAV